MNFMETSNLQRRLLGYANVVTEEDTEDKETLGHKDMDAS